MTQLSTSDLDGTELRESLLVRRRQLITQPHRAASVRVAALLSEVDAALERLDDGSWGVCTRCHGHVEPELLETDPTASVCLDCFTEAERRDLERDLTLASRVQDSLLPPRDFNAHGWSGHYLYRPHAVVSGDYVDVVTTDGVGGDVLVMVGDVSGKGIAAALLMSHLHAAFRSMAVNGMALVEMMDQVNRLLCAATTANTFATLVATRLHSNGAVEMCSAGHTPLLRSSAGGVESVPANGMPLGMFCETRFTSCQFRLEPGDGLVLYSDGLTESADEDEVELGVRGVRDALLATEMSDPSVVVAALAAAEAGHRRDATPVDDLTVLALSRLTV